MVVWNERIKLLANFANGTAVAMVALGILTPTANILFLGTAETSAGMLVWWTLGALTLHGIGSWFLADLTDE